MHEVDGEVNINKERQKTMFHFYMIFNGPINVYICFKGLMLRKYRKYLYFPGALFLDGGVPLADKVFSKALFQTEDDLLDIWSALPPHPLIQDEPHGDRHWIMNSPALQVQYMYSISL